MTKILPEIGSTEQGTIAATFAFPWPWPLSADAVAYRVRLSDGSLTLVFEASARIRVELSRGAEKIESRSCVLNVPYETANSLIVVWRYPVVEMFLGETLIASSKPDAAVPTEITVPAMPADRRPYDFTAESEAAVAKRQSKLGGFSGNSPQGGRKRADTDYIFAELENELLQIDDLLQLIKQGRTHHAVGLSSHVRKLIVTGRPMPLVQLCASALNEKLTVYTAASTNRKALLSPKDVPPPLHGIRFSATFKPDLLHFNPIDLDVWLETEGSQIGNETVTNKLLLKKIGDTVGAHFDIDTMPSVSLLRQSSSGTGIGELDSFIRYVCSAAALAAQLSRHLLMRRQQP